MHTVYSHNVLSLIYFKWQCHEIFGIFFCLKDLTCVPYEQTKTVTRTFFFSRGYVFDRKARKIRLHAVLVSDERIFFTI